jgi:hypothetical protein
MRPVDIFAIAVAIVIALLSLVVQPWSLPWWSALIAASFVAVGASLHIFVGGGASRITKLTTTLFLVVGIPSFGYWYYSRYPLSLAIMRDVFPLAFSVSPVKQPLTTLPGQMLSRSDRFIFSCDVPLPDKETAEKFSQMKNELTQSYQIWGDITGISFTVSDIRGGLKIDVEATTEEAKRRLFTAGSGGLTKLAIEIRRLGQKEFVTVKADMPESLRIFSLMIPQPQAQETITLQKKIENMLGVPDGKCQLL